MNLLLKNVIITDPEGPHHGMKADILIREGIIERVGEAGSIQAEGEAFEQNGAHVSPGWVDTGAYLNDPGHEYKENLKALAQAACRGGFTDVACYPNTLPVADNAQLIHSIRSRAAGLPARLHPMGAITRKAEGLELAELFDMQQAGAIAFSDGVHPLQSPGIYQRALLYCQPFNGLCISYPVEESLASGQMNESPQATLLGMKGIPEMAEHAMTARLLPLLAYTGGRLHLQAMTSPAALAAAVAAKASMPGLSIGVSALHLALHDSLLADFDSNYKIFPPLRDAEQVAALRHAVASGLVDSFCSLHSAQGPEEKNVEFELAEAGMLALQTHFSLLVKSLIRSGSCSLDLVVRMLTDNARRILGLPPRKVAQGMPADLSLFDPDAEWRFEKRQLYSRANNSPLLGQSLPGKVLGTLCAGRPFLHAD